MSIKDVSGLVLWLNADDLNLSNGDTVHNWTGRDTVGANTTSIDSLNKPRMSIIDDEKYVHFDGLVGQKMNIDTNIFNGNNSFTIFAKIRPLSNGHILGMGTSTSPYYTYLRGLAIQSNKIVSSSRRNGNGTFVESKLTDIFNKTHFITNVITVGESFIEIKNEDRQVVSKDSVTSTSIDFHPYTRSTIGASDGGATGAFISPFSGYIKELVVFNRALSKEEIKEAEKTLFKFKRILLKSNNKFYSLQSTQLNEIQNDDVENFINHGAISVNDFNVIHFNKNYILSPNEGNTSGVFEQQISRKPLTISSTNKLAILHDGTYYTSTDGSTLTPLTDESEVETLGFNSLTLSQTVYDLVGVNPAIVAFSNTEADITIETTTEPFTLYDEFSDEVEVLFYTGDDTVTDANLVLEANWSPIDELEGNFEIVTWTDEANSTRTLELNGIPSPKFIAKSTVSNIGGTLSGIILNDSSTYATSSNVRFLLTNNNSTWYKWNGTNFVNVTYSKVDDILTLGNTYAELSNADYSKWTHSKINIGVFLKDDDNTTSKVNQLGFTTNSPIRTSQVSDLNFYILNTTAKIELDLKGLWLSGQLSDLDLTRVQYRVFLNEQPYFPLDGKFTNLDNPPLNIDITFKSEEIKINDWNTLRVEFKDSFGTVDYWQTTFVGNYSSLMFMDTDSNYYSDDVGKVLQYLDFGTFFGGQYSVEHEVIVKNQYGYDVENLTIEASTGHLPEGVEVQFSDTANPFTPQPSLILPSELKNDEQVSFYIRMISDIDSVPNGENKFNIFVKAERKV